MTEYGEATEAKIREVVDTCRRHGGDSIIALAGVPGTGKSFVAGIAAQRMTDEPCLVREIQFHPSFTYEEFVEGFRAQASGVFAVEKGVFLEWNDLAAADSERTYVLLIEEFTRTNLPSILGEILTYVEYRDRPFFTIYSRRPVTLAKKLVILATYNPRDRSALELDEAILRRLRVIWFVPSEMQLEEMLRRSLPLDHDSPLPPWIKELQGLFKACRDNHSNEFETLMPFGHGMFSSVRNETPDLYQLWGQRILPIIQRPLLQPHPFYETIKEHYPWRHPDYVAS